MSSGWALISEESGTGSEVEPMEQDEPEYNEKEQTPSGQNDRKKTRTQPVEFHVRPEYDEYLRGKPFMTVNSAHTFLRENCPDRISRKASAALVGVVQSLMMELIDEILTIMQVTKRKRISPKIISMAVKDDPELMKLLSNVTIPDSGIFGYIKDFDDI